MPAHPIVGQGRLEERQRQSVQLDPFFLAKHEMTQGQWMRLTGGNPSYNKSENNLALPVESVGWFDCEEALRRAGLVLPSELRWEYAIRAGTTTEWWTGNTEGQVRTNENVNGVLLVVGSKSTNGFGLFDMGGNVWEWCMDEHADYGTERRGDGLRTASSDGAADRSVRGGCFDFGPGDARSGLRSRSRPSFRSSLLGLRPARTARL